MPRCPNRGSSAQLQEMCDTAYNEDGWTIEVVRVYRCGCGQWSVGKSYFHCEDCYEDMTPLINEKGS